VRAPFTAKGQETRRARARTLGAHVETFPAALQALDFETLDASRHDEGPVSSNPQEASMSIRDSAVEQYRWWLLDGDLDVVSDGTIDGESIPAVLVRVSRELELLGERGMTPMNHPYRLIVFKGGSVVAVRPPTVGIC
jgi:hypothetical protein